MLARLFVLFFVISCCFTNIRCKQDYNCECKEFFETNVKTDSVLNVNQSTGDSTYKDKIIEDSLVLSNTVITSSKNKAHESCVRRRNTYGDQGEVRCTLR